MPYVTVTVRVPEQVANRARETAKILGWQLADYMTTLICLRGLELMKLPRSFSLQFSQRPYTFRFMAASRNWQPSAFPRESCEHRFSAEVAAAVVRPVADTDQEQNLKCRYCGSSDVSGCGYRYNAYGISKRIRCNECHRKFSIKQPDPPGFKRLPSETVWLLSEIGMVLNKLENLIEKISLNFRVT